MSWNSSTFQPVWPLQWGLGPRPTPQGLNPDRVGVTERGSDLKPIPNKIQRNEEIGKYILQGHETNPFGRIWKVSEGEEKIGGHGPNCGRPTTSFIGTFELISKTNDESPQVLKQGMRHTKWYFSKVNLEGFKEWIGRERDKLQAKWAGNTTAP